jgi:hypothetical protein
MWKLVSRHIIEKFIQGDLYIADSLSEGGGAYLVRLAMRPAM